MFPIHTVLPTSFLLFACAFAATIDSTSDLVISNKVIGPDGFNRPTVLAGGTFPGPLIKSSKGQRFRLNVLDRLTDKSMFLSTSVHWHGIFQHGTNFADGASFATQCPITANSSFEYDFTPQDQVGTYWYHSHLGTQYCDGLRGPLVIYDPNDPHRSLYDVDDESTVITLADWYHAPSPGAIASGVQFIADSTLINGKGRFPGGPAVPLSIVNVQKGRKYRLRLIAMSCDPNFMFSIDNHDLTIIEADGISTQPLKVNKIQILAGQRYSVVLSACQPIGNYWIRAEPNADRATPGFVGGINSAILRYAGAPNKDPVTKETTSPPLLESNLRSYTKVAVPGKPHVGGADLVFNFKMDFDFTAFKFTMNGASWTPPTVPVLLQILSGAKTAQQLLPEGSYYALPANKVIEVTIPGVGVELGGPHPFHLHGHSFHVIRSADSDKYNFKDPVRRDTVSTGLAGGNTTIRFVTDNAGPWLLHCHIDFHFNLGLAVVFAEDIPHIASANPVPAAWKKLCPSYDGLTPDQL